MINMELARDLQFASSPNADDEQNSAFLKAQALFITLRALLIAACTKARGNITRLGIPGVKETAPISFTRVVRLSDWIDRWVRWFTFRSRHQCYYRSYALICALRRNGIAAQFNVGLRNLRVKEKNRGHCWLTFNGKPIIIEDDYVRQIYPYMLKEQSDGITFWAGSNDGHTLKRVKHLHP